MGSPVWAARQVPAAPTALPERSAAARQRALEAVRLFARAAGVRTDAGDVEYVGTSRSASAPNRAVERYAQAASPFDVDPSSDTVVAFARGGTAQPELVGSALTDAELEQRARTFIAQVAPGLDLARLVPNHSAKPSTLPGAALTSYALRWEDRSGSRTARCATEGQPCSNPGQDAFVEVVLSRAGEVLWYTNTLADGTSRAPAVPTTGAGG